MACQAPAPKVLTTSPAGPDGLGERFSIIVVDVGDSEATLVLGPGDPEERIAMLIGAGHREAIESVIEQTHVERLHYVVLSHHDTDHIRGLAGNEGLVWSSAMVVEEAEEKPVEEKASELAADYAEHLAKVSAANVPAGKRREPAPLGIPEPYSYEPASRKQAELRRALVCSATALSPQTAVIDSGSPGRAEDPGKVWRACAGQLGLQVGHVEVVEGRHVGEVFALGEGLTARIVAGGGYVWGHDGPVEPEDNLEGHGIVLLVSNGQGFEFLLMPDLGGKKRRAPTTTLIKEAIADTLAKEGIDVDVVRVGDHGAENGVSRRLLSRTKPEVAILSTGDEQVGDVPLPRCRTLDGLASGKASMILQTGMGNPRCDAGDDQRRFVADGTIRIDVTGSDYTISTMGERSPVSGRRTRKIAFACSVRRGCYWSKDLER
jgi:beta-lactamase superfamily II metal-dependent hydrolase